ncbi:MAG TPA: hypothetical protein VGR94_04335 [Candidatus Acidoferrales bacterium]|nr:hypothetical protein [Candidatus Acidoferrales bacterium]
MSVFNRYLLFRLACPTVLRFPFTDHFLRSLPIAQFERLAYLFAAEETVNPNWAQAMPVLASLRTLLATSSVTAVNGQHRATLLANSGFRR